MLPGFPSEFNSPWETHYGVAHLIVWGWETQGSSFPGTVFSCTGSVSEPLAPQSVGHSWQLNHPHTDTNAHSNSRDQCPGHTWTHSPNTAPPPPAAPHCRLSQMLPLGPRNNIHRDTSKVNGSTCSASLSPWGHGAPGTGPNTSRQQPARRRWGKGSSKH